MQSDKLPFAYKTSNTFICGIKILRFNENDILVQINFGVQNILWLYVHSEEKLMLIRQFCSIFYQMHIVASHKGDFNGMQLYIYLKEWCRKSQILIW